VADQESDVLGQIRAFYEQTAALPPPLTRITLSPGLMPWIRARFPQLGSGASAEPVVGLLGVAIVEDDRFWLGQVRLHYGERFRDFYAMPPEAPTHLVALGPESGIEPWDVSAAIRGF
jgi:hypothetical protein